MSLLDPEVERLWRVVGRCVLLGMLWREKAKESRGRWERDEVDDDGHFLGQSLLTDVYVPLTTY